MTFDEYLRAYRVPLVRPDLSRKHRKPAHIPVKVTSKALANAKELAAKCNTGAAGLTDVAEFINRSPNNRKAWEEARKLVRLPVSI